MTTRYRFKVVLIGNEAVGKTSLILRYINHTFSENYIATLGVNFLTKDLALDGEDTRLIIWDIGGQETWKAKLPLYLKGADGAIIVFDLTRPLTFIAVEDWLIKLKSIAGETIPFILVGNKNDLADLHKVKDKDVKRFLKKHDHSFFYKSSAKTGENVETFFATIANEIIKSKPT
jgi:Ras-related protein Rab-6A